MNRTPIAVKPSLVPTPHSSSVHWEQAVRPQVPPSFRSSTSPICLFSPINYEANYAYPLVVWLHGESSCELELRQVMPLLSNRNYVGTAPRGTQAHAGQERRFCWGDSATAVAEMCQRVRSAITEASWQFNVHPHRIFVAGNGTGGTMALRVGWQYPELFAGVISLGGRVPRGGMMFRRLNHARQLPVLLSLSPDDACFSLSNLQDDLRLLHSGGIPTSVHLYPDGDGVTTTMLSMVDEWMMHLACPSVVPNS